MKHIGNELNNILNQKAIKKKDFAKLIDMSDVNLSKIFKKESIDASLLDRITKALDIPASYFFDEGNTVNTTSNSNNKLKNTTGDNSSQNITLGKKENEIEGLKIEIKAIKEQIEEYKTIIKQKDEMIEKLLKMNN